MSRSDAERLRPLEDAATPAEVMAGWSSDHTLGEVVEAITGLLRADGARWNRYPLSDAGNAELFAELCGGHLLFNHRLNRWMVWRGDWWEPDSADEALAAAVVAARVRRALCGEQASGEPKEVAKLIGRCIGNENKNKLRSCLEVASTAAWLGVPATVEWDADPWTLGVANGVLDLRTGQLRRGRPEELIARHVPITFDSDAACPSWDRFLHDVFQGDAELIEFVWRAIGYTLTGDTGCQVLFFCSGEGENGKSIFIHMLEQLLGPYAVSTPFTTLESAGRTNSDISPALVRLDGARLITASESSEASRFNAARLKALTGGDLISARMPYGDMFTFRPVGKIWLAANDQPRSRDDSHGFWRRMLVLPFGVEFGAPGAPAKRDPEELLGALEAELPGILVKAARAAVRWREARDARQTPQSGLTRPKTVDAAVEEYKAENDEIGEFLESCTVAGDEFEIPKPELYAAYKEWCHKHELLPVMHHTTFGTKVGRQRVPETKQARYRSRRVGKRRIWVGLKLRELWNTAPSAAEVRRVEAEANQMALDLGMGGAGQGVTG